MADYSDLINKTIFDFCDDEKIIEQIVDIDGYCTKEWHIEGYKKYHIDNCHALYELACITNNEELKMAVEVQFKDVLDEHFNE